MYMPWVRPALRECPGRNVIDLWKWTAPQAEFPPQVTVQTQPFKKGPDEGL